MFELISKQNTYTVNTNGCILMKYHYFHTIPVIKIKFYAFSDVGLYLLNSWNSNLQWNTSDKGPNIIDRSNLKLKLLHESRMEELNKRLKQILNRRK